MELKIDYQVKSIHSDGKKTKVSIQAKGHYEIFEGTSRCNPTDEFNPVIGVMIATRRAVANMINRYIAEDNWADGNGFRKMPHNDIIKF